MNARTLLTLSVSAPLLALLASAPAFAVTRATFLIGGRAIITVSDPSLGPADGDAQALYEAMDVPPKDSLIGPGKAIATSSQDFNLTCGIRNGKQYTCSLVLQESARTHLNAGAERAEFTLQGAEAQAMSALFVRQPGSSAIFQTRDGFFRISGNDLEFRFTFQK